jgi:hypothetical protein
MNREKITDFGTQICFLFGRTVMWWVCVQHLVLTVHFGSFTPLLVFKSVTVI